MPERTRDRAYLIDDEPETGSETKWKNVEEGVEEPPPFVKDCGSVITAERKE